MREMMAGREAEGQRLSTIRTSVSYRGRCRSEHRAAPLSAGQLYDPRRGQTPLGPCGRCVGIARLLRSGRASRPSDQRHGGAGPAANVRDRLAEEGIELDGDPECTTDMNLDGVDLTGTAECTGTTTDGRSAKANFDGTLSPGSCEGSFVIEVDGEQVVDLTEIPGCSIEF
jgi:hypothetical protein